MSRIGSIQSKQQSGIRSKSISLGFLLLVALIWVAVIGSALGVVASTQAVRGNVNRLETLRREAGQLQVQWGQYLLEQSTWAAYGRVETVAVSELNMMAPTLEETVMISGSQVAANRGGNLQHSLGAEQE